MSNNNKTPAIRFKGFTDTWEQRKLGEISESFEYGLNAAATEYDGKHKYIRITDIDDSTHLFLQDDLTSPDIDFSTADDYLLQEGDVLFARTGASVGKTYIYRRSDGDLYFAGFLIRAKIKSDYDADFVFQNTLTDSYDSYIRITSQRSGQPGVNAQEYANFALSVPSLAEQKKIGAYFSHLDSLITLHQRKCDKLIQFKAAMLKKMFPQNGADKPELRFKGFTDAWEQRKLGELMEITSVKRIHQSDWTDSGVRFLRARDIVAVSKNEKVSEPLFISQEKYDEYSALSGKVKIGDLPVTGVGTIGVPMLINNEEPLYFKDGNIIWFKNEDRIDGEFFYHSFNGSFIQNFIKESAGIGTVGTYTIESGKKTPILLPTQKDEQQKIGTFFSQLDTLITLHQRKCDKYKSIKAGLIRKFFP